MKSKFFLISVISVFLVHCNEPNASSFAETNIQKNETKPLEEAVIEEEKIIGELKTGYYFYMADAAVFTLCESGNRYPVIPEEANIDAEKIFLNAQIDDEIRNVFITIRMSFKDAPNMEGAVVKQVLIHEVIEKVEDCP